MQENSSHSTEASFWAILEMMGHVVTAGHLSEEVLFGKPLIRLDFPNTENQEAYTQYISPESIYRITPTTEETARQIAAQHDSRPTVLYNLEYSLNQRLLALQAGNEEEEDYD